MTYPKLMAIFIVAAVVFVIIGYVLPRRRYGFDEGDITGYTFMAWLVAALLIVAGGITLGVGKTEDYEQRHCLYTIHDQTGLPTHYERWHGCFITVDGRTIPYEKWINNTQTNAD
jgi:hypothetical protein